MSKKALAAFLSGVGVTMPWAWLIGYSYPEWTVYPICVASVVAVFTSFEIERLE